MTLETETAAAHRAVDSTISTLDRINELAADEKCPHCYRAWHRMALTERVEKMFTTGYMDADYFSREDTSPILCDGSTFIGPLRPEPKPTTGWIDQMICSAKTWLPDLLVPDVPDVPDEPYYSFSNSGYSSIGIVQGAPWLILHDKFWNELSTNKLPCEETPPTDLPAVEFGPQNWLPAAEPVQAVPMLRATVNKRWQDFTAEDFPVPERPGLDFSEYVDDSEPYYLNKKGQK